MTTIVVPLDGSPFAERALRPACSIAARQERSRVLLLSCSDDIDQTQHRLDELAGLYSEVVTVETRRVLHGDPAEVILATVATEPDSTLCMATHGRSGLTRITMGSVTNEVVRHAPCPVLITRPTDDRTCLDA